MTKGFVLIYCKHAPFKININQEHSIKQYELPSLIANNSDTLFSAHKYSYIYNNMNVRLDKLIFDDEQLSRRDLSRGFSAFKEFFENKGA